MTEKKDQEPDPSDLPDLPLIPDLSTLPAPTITPYARFHASVQRFATDTRSGELMLTLAIQQEEKYEAFRVTDLIGQEMMVDVGQIVYPEDLVDIEGYDEGYDEDWESEAGDDGS